MIKELNDLVHFIKTSVWRDEELLGFFTREDPDLLSLYQAIWQNTLHSDESAAQAIGTGLTRYKQLGRNLRKHLRNLSVFFNEEKAKADATTRNYHEGALELAFMQLLHARGYRHAPLEIAKRLYRRGIDYEWPVFVAEALRIMKAAAASRHGQEKAFELYAGQYRMYRQYADWEEQAAEYVQWSKLPGLHRMLTPQQIQERLRGYLDQLGEHLGAVPSYWFHLHYFRLRGDYALGQEDYAGAIDGYDEALAYFQARPYPVNEALAMFHCHKIIACTLLNRYEQGETAALAALDHAPDGSFAFFYAYELYFYLAMHTAHFEQALDIFQTATLHKRFGNLSLPQRETWHLLGAYLFIVYQLNGWPLPDKSLPVFKSFRFVNETPASLRDKQGRNTAAQLAHLLLQILEGRDDAALERLDALDKYRSRYLQGAATARSERLVKILGCLPAAGFGADAFLRKTRRLRDQLTQLPRQLANRTHELEIIPYEQLIQHLAGYLVRRKKNGK